MTQRNRFKRVKHGQEPGDLPKATKIEMREGDDVTPLPWGQTVNKNAAKSFRKLIINKGKTKERQRGKKQIERELNDE